jgi:ribulose-5-phosphate 4-epimerase/fuculose-1-phosphate aldolase
VEKWKVDKWKKWCAALGLAALAAAPSPTAQAPLTSAGAVSPALIEDLVAANRILAMEGIVDAYGHVSIRHPANPNRYLLSRSQGPEFVVAADIMEYDLDSTPIDPKGRVSVVERFIHGEIYKARPDVQAVVHGHSAGVVTFSITQVPLRAIYHQASFLWVGVPVWDIRDAKDPTASTLLVRNGPVGASLARGLGNKPVALMRGHGAVIVGPDLQTAVRRAVFTEDNAQILSAALRLGGPINYITDAEGESRDKTPGDNARGWEYWKRKALGR